MSQATHCQECLSCPGRIHTECSPKTVMQWPKDTRVFAFCFHLFPTYPIWTGKQWKYLAKNRSRLEADDAHKSCHGNGVLANILPDLKTLRVLFHLPCLWADNVQVLLSVLHSQGHTEPLMAKAALLSFSRSYINNDHFNSLIKRKRLDITVLIT